MAPSRPRLDDIYPTITFAEDVGQMQKDLGSRSDAAIDEICAACSRLQQYPWPADLPVYDYDGEGTYCYPISNILSFTYEVKVELDAAGKNIGNTYYLKNLLRNQ